MICSLKLDCAICICVSFRNYHHINLNILLQNCSLISPIDGKSMDEIASVKIFHGSEFKTNGKVIRWTEVIEKRIQVLFLFTFCIIFGCLRMGLTVGQE